MSNDNSTEKFSREYKSGYAAGLRGHPDALGRADERGVGPDWYRGFHHAAAGEPVGGWDA